MPFRFTREYLDNMPAINGIPRYIKTLSAICIMLMFSTLPCIPNNGGKTVINILPKYYRKILEKYC